LLTHKLEGTESKWSQHEVVLHADIILLCFPLWLIVTLS